MRPRVLPGILRCLLLVIKVDVLQKDADIIKSAMATKEDIRLMNERQDFQMEKLVRQEEDIYRLKRLVGVK